MKTVDPRGVALRTSVLQGLESRVEQRAFRGRAARRRDAQHYCFRFSDRKGSIQSSFDSSDAHETIILYICVVRVVQTPHTTVDEAAIVRNNTSELNHDDGAVKAPHHRLAQQH